MSQSLFMEGIEQTIYLKGRLLESKNTSEAYKIITGILYTHEKSFATWAAIKTLTTIYMRLLA